MKRNIVICLILTAFCLICTSCGALIVGGVGAAAGYVAHDEGYTVQSPLAKEKAPKLTPKTEKQAPPTLESKQKEEKNVAPEADPQKEMLTPVGPKL